MLRSFNNNFLSYGGRFLDFTSTLSDDFIIRVKTDNAGTSASNQFTLPCFGSGYDFTAKWDNGDTTTHSGSPGNITFTRPTVGEHTLIISGVFPTIRFAGGGDKDKLIRTINLGDVGWNSLAQAFQGCSNNVIDPSCTGNFDNVTVANSAWQSNISNNFFPQIDFPICTNFASAWFQNPIPDFPDIDMSEAINLQSTWREMGVMTAFRTRRFYKAVFGDGANPVGSNFTFLFTTLPTADYSDVLITQRANNPNNSVTFHGGSSKYNTAGGTARGELVSIQSWIITDGGAE